MLLFVSEFSLVAPLVQATLLINCAGWTGPTVCQSPGICCYYNRYDSQCLPPNYSCPEGVLITSTTSPLLQPPSVSSLQLLSNLYPYGVNAVKTVSWPTLPNALPFSLLFRPRFVDCRKFNQVNRVCWCDCVRTRIKVLLLHAFYQSISSSGLRLRDSFAYLKYNDNYQDNHYNNDNDS